MDIAIILLMDPDICPILNCRWCSHKYRLYQDMLICNALLLIALVFRVDVYS